MVRPRNRQPNGFLEFDQGENIGQQVIDEHNPGNADDQHGTNDMKEREAEGVIVFHTGL
jgi:hypothetical protein